MRKTYWRKLTEILLSFRIERSLSKNEILELYLNKIFLGHRAYGIEAAARAMKEKSLENLRVLIEKIVQDKIDTRQLDNDDLTLREIRIFKETILEKLMNIYHIRIEYPEDRSQNKK